MTDDEAFWREQERRKKDQLGQPCCTQSGMSWSMIDLPGNFAVVIHGEYDCVNCFHHHIGRSAWRYYSTRLTEEMITTGRTEPALRACLELIAKEEAPEFVLVLGTCPVEVIGDAFHHVVASVSEATGVPMVALRTSGLKLSSQAAMLDWLFSTLAAIPAGPPVDRAWERELALLAMEVVFDAHAGGSSAADVFARLRQLAAPATEASDVRVNLVGMPSTVEGAVPEPVALLAAAGVVVNGVYPEGASLASWRAVRHAGDNFVVDTTMYPRFLDVLRGYGQRVHEVPLPVGLGPSRSFYETIGRATGAPSAVEAAVNPLATRASEALAALRSDVAGKRVAIALRMHANYASDTLAYEGLGEVAAYQEFGFEVELFVQGPPEEAARQAFAEGLAARGCTLPFQVFGGPWILGEKLRSGGFSLAVGSDTVRNELASVDVPLLTTRALAPYLTGVVHNVDLIRQVLARGAR
ncbi:MAG: Nitrogenase component 1 type Oxidoreductase [Pseudomonadota bacterium]